MTINVQSMQSISILRLKLSYYSFCGCPIYDRPSGVHNFRYVVLNKIGDKEMKFDNKVEWTINTAMVLFLFCGIIFWFWNNQRFTYSGLHKKRDL